MILSLSLGRFYIFAIQRCIMKYLIIVFFLFSSLIYSNTPVWGKTGHRVVGEVAQKYLSGKAQRKIKKLLRGQSLAAVSTYADEIKSDQKYSGFSPWHYVNFPADKLYTEVEPSPYGDVIMGINKCIQVLENEGSSEADKVFYLKLLVHLVGDLHQPMHAGRAENKGGNDIQIQWFNQGSNLHRLWDSNLIDYYGMSYTELADKIDHLSKKERKEMAMGDILVWVEESQDIANELYDSVKVGEKIGYAYSYNYWPTVEDQLLKGGVRLAKILNEIFR